MFQLSMIQRWRRPWLTRSAMPRDKAPSGHVAALSEHGLAMVEFGEMTEADLRAGFPGASLVKDPTTLQATLGRLRDLIEHPESDGDFALDLRGSAFEFKVWNALREIPAGTTATYGEIAARVGSPREAREVGEACAANKLAVVVPCHGIVKKDGSIPAIAGASGASGRCSNVNTGLASCVRPRPSHMERHRPEECGDA